jgi:hypothetical protein
MKFLVRQQTDVLCNVLTLDNDVEFNVETYANSGHKHI